jgi:acyl carrier protein|tara:strand:- start:145 stop:387 length:243 start_codon:yes stop_codon:yes gene_type:complete
MSINNLEKKIIIVLKKIFPRTKIKKNIKDLSINSFKDWDSLANFNLLLEIEKEFGTRFTTEQMSEIKSIKQIIKVLKKKS